MSLRLKYPYFKEPRGGWHLPVDGIVFKADSPEEVIEKVRGYYAANNRPPRDVEGDLIDYCAKKFPHLVTEGDRRPLRVDPLDRVMVNNLMFSRHALVNKPEEDDVKARIATCAKCPHNKSIAGRLAADVNRVSYLLTKGELPPLGRCDQHGWDNRVAVQWDAAVTSPAAAGLVDGCWVLPQGGRKLSGA
jgi:hypothetical protein